MPHILLATYHYYPWFWGGSEVYVRGLVKFLQAEGWQVTLIAGITEPLLKECAPLHEDEFLSAGTYEHEGTQVIGVLNHRASKEELYSRYNPAWVRSWTTVLNKISLHENPPALLHLHGLTSLLNRSLVEAVRGICPGTYTAFSYHVAESCPKNSLTWFNQATCNVKPSVATCTACVLHERIGGSPSVAKVLATLLPDLPLPEKVPAVLQAKRLTRLHMEGYARFAEVIDHWFVFSQQIKEAIGRIGVEPSKISVLRHGVGNGKNDGNGSNSGGNFKLPPEFGHARPSSPLRFLFVGRFKKVKGIETLLRAWLSMEESPELRRLTLVGDDQAMAPAIAALLEKVKRRSDVEWLGFLPLEKIETLMQQSHCLIVPSEVSETGPLVLHEAVACGANVLASNIGGAAELCEWYGEGCQTFRMGDADDLVRRIRAFRFLIINKKVQSEREHYAAVVEKYRQLRNDERMFATHNPTIEIVG